MDKLKSFIIDKDVMEKLDTLEEFNSSTLSDDIIFKIIPQEMVIDPNKKCKLGTNLFYDLEFFNDYLNSKDNSSILDFVNKSNLKGSRHYLEFILSNPIYCIDTLECRQRVVKNLKEKLLASSDQFNRLKVLENDMLWMYEIKDTDKGFDMLYDMVYFNSWMIKKLNNNEQVLNTYNIYRIIGSPTIGIMSPITYFIIPYLILFYQMKVKVSFITYVKMIAKTIFSMSSVGILGKMKYVSILFSIIFYFQGLFNSIEISKATYKISETITNKINNVVEYIQISKKLNDELWTNDISSFIEDPSITNISKTNYFDNYKLKKFGIFSGFGRQLKIYKFIKNTMYVSLFRRIYILDALLSICNLENFSYPKFIKDAKAPIVNITGMWHPCIDSTRRVTNDLYIEDQRNLIITGPNAGGKSTTIKTFLILIIFSQTFGISPVDEISLTPFYYISSQINIPDCKGKESLFEAEMYRSKNNIEVVSSLENDKFSILAMDEIFNSTNPIEGISGAYAICKKLSSYNNNICIISTHYLYLTKLQKAYPDRFINYKINVVMNDKNVVVRYPYKIKEGISRQYIAIELLKENGFDKDIIEDALMIKSKFIKKTVSLESK